MRLKKYLPRSLFGRALLIVALPVLLLQGLVAYLFIQRHFDSVTGQLTEIAAQELRLAVVEVEDAPDRAAAQQALRALSLALRIDFALGDSAAAPDESRRIFDFSGGAAAQTLAATISREVVVDTTSYDKRIKVVIPTDKGALSALIARSRLTISNPHQLLVVMALSALALLAVAVQFLRNQVRPIRELAGAAEAFGKGRSLRFRPSGAEEVRRAGAAFMEMRGRIERHIDSRTRMLSGVSHDMRTPLARMKLALEMMEEGEDVTELRQDIAQMERMLDEFLAFARGESGEEAQELDPAALAREVVERAAKTGRVVELSVIGEGLAALRRDALARALDNLVENAARHARTIALTVEIRPGRVAFLVEDDGPGIAPQDREAALAPFSRLDAARNQDQGGGVGLGLSIAQDVARAHGGRLELDRSARLGGLLAQIALPR